MITRSCEEHHRSSFCKSILNCGLQLKKSLQVVRATICRLFSVCQNSRWSSQPVLSCSQSSGHSILPTWCEKRTSMMGSQWAPPERLQNQDASGIKTFNPAGISHLDCSWEWKQLEKGCKKGLASGGPQLWPPPLKQLGHQEALASVTGSEVQANKAQRLQGSIYEVQTASSQALQYWSAKSSPGCQRWKSRKSSEDKEQICECNLHLEHETEVQTLGVSFFHYKNYKRETNTASDCSHIEPRVKILQKMALQGWCCVIVHSVDLCHGSLVAVRQHKGEQGRGKVTKPLWGSWRGTQCRNGQTTDSCLCHFPAHSTSLTETSLDSCIPLILSVAMAAPWRLLKTV